MTYPNGFDKNNIANNCHGNKSKHPVCNFCIRVYLQSARNLVSSHSNEENVQINGSNVKQLAECFKSTKDKVDYLFTIHSKKEVWGHWKCQDQWCNPSWCSFSNFFNDCFGNRYINSKGILSLTSKYPCQRYPKRPPIKVRCTTHPCEFFIALAWNQGNFRLVVLPGSQCQIKITRMLKGLFQLLNSLFPCLLNCRALWCWSTQRENN